MNQIEFTSAYEQSNKSHPEWKPSLYLGWKGRDGNELTIRYGATKLNDILGVLDLVKKAIDEHKPENGLFTMPITFHEKEKFGTWTETFTIKKWEIYNHYREDIKAYVAKYYVPYVPKGQQLYTAPVAEQYEDERCNVKWVLRVPCYPKEATDVGEGMRAWSVSESRASLMVREGLGGKVYAEIKAWNASPATMNKPFVFKHIYGLKEYDIEVTPEQQKAFLDHYDAFLKFVVSPQSLA